MCEDMSEGSGTIDEQGGVLVPSDVPEPTPHLTFDPQDYLHFLEGLDLTFEEKVDHLHALWIYMASFVDRAWGDDPVQLLPAWREFASAQAQDELTIEASVIDNFNEVAPGDGGEGDNHDGHS